MKKKLIQATCLFFVMMLIFTILSRVSDSVNVIQIQTKNPANQMITHEVKGSGKVEGSQEVAVFVLENLQVEQVVVNPPGVPHAVLFGVSFAVPAGSLLAASRLLSLRYCTDARSVTPGRTLKTSSRTAAGYSAT